MNLVLIPASRTITTGAGASQITILRIRSISNSLPSSHQTKPPRIPKREYFYQINRQGQLHLADTKHKNFTTAFTDPSFLNFFYSRLFEASRVPFRKPTAASTQTSATSTSTSKISSPTTSSSSSNDHYNYVSVCGAECNWIHAVDSPIVFKHFVIEKEGEKEKICTQSPLQAADGPFKLVWAGDLSIPFHPSKLFKKKGEGDGLYHELPRDVAERVGERGGLLESRMVILGLGELMEQVDEEEEGLDMDMDSKEETEKENGACFLRWGEERFRVPVVL